MAEECLFCKIIKGEIPSEKVYEDEASYAFKDINPTSPHHILVIPKKHISALKDLKEADKELMGHLMLSVNKVASKLGLEEYRVVNNCGASAGQSVFHIHMHLMGGRDFTWPAG